MSEPIVNPRPASSPAPEKTARSGRLAAGIALAAAVSAITGVVSYNHGLDVARWTGNTGLVAYLVPLVPDLMIGMSSLALLEASAARAKRPAAAVVALAAGIGWTVAQNVAAGLHSSWGGALIAAGIPLALVATFETFLWLLRLRNRDVTGITPKPTETVSTDVALALLVGSASERLLADALGVPRSRVQAWKDQLKPAPEPGPEEADADAA